MTLSPQDNAKIVAYWAKRQQGYTTAEMEDLYRLVFPLLMRTLLPDEFADQEERAALVHAFIADRFLINGLTSKAGPLVDAYALHRFLKKYAISWLRDRKKAVPLDENDAPEDADEDDADGDDCMAADDPVSSQRQLLAEAGIALDRAQESAERFLDSLEVGERTYLVRNACADEDDKEAISSIAERLALGSSYHYKARKLGITGEKGGFYEGYEHTKIGKWLSSLGVAISKDWQRELVALLMVLCERALAKGRGV